MKESLQSIRDLVTEPSRTFEHLKSSPTLTTAKLMGGGVNPKLTNVDRSH